MNGFFLFQFFLIFSQESDQSFLSKRTYQTYPIDQKDAPTIDGSLDEPLWLEENNWSGDFIQRQPLENQAPTAQTSFKIVYDSKFLYIGIHCFDNEPDKINRRMSRRDGFNGDWVEVIIDSFNDLRSAFSFSISAAGVRSDQSLSLNGQVEDPAWNPIWVAKSLLNAQGWSAEMKIPLSQLRFDSETNTSWGLQVRRRILRKEEFSVWQRVPQNAPGWVSEFGKMTGLQNLKAQKPLELQPFAVGSLQTFEIEPNNPFRDEATSTLDFGVDGKIGLTNDLTVDLTINPDFGQVEADPGAIALDGFQLFFEEQRPFFVENKGIFDYRFSAPLGGSNYGNDNLFYSRRIGRNPQGSFVLDSSEFAQVDARTNILGAMKLSGKTQRGFSIGILESVTAAEYVDITDRRNTRRQLVEPMTNYFTARLQQDFNEKNTFIGGILTAVNRQLTDEVSFLHRSAYTGGLDFRHQWQDRNWYLGSNFIMSQVMGSPEAILRTQTAIPHLFQRENLGYITLDSSRTSLTGTGGDIKLGKAGKGNLRFESGVTWRSPELELNDLGFMREADVIQHYTWINFGSVNAFGPFRNASIGYKHWFDWDFGGNLNYIDWDVEANGTFQNNWSATVGFFSQPHIYSKSLLQGGPRIRLTDQYGLWWSVGTDNRKKLSIRLHGWTKDGGRGSYYLLENGFEIVYQPTDPLKISLSPTYTHIGHRLQFNETVSFQGQHRHITSLLDQETLTISLRFDYAITPNLVIQYYGQPFITSGQYDRFSHVVNPTMTYGEEQLHFYSDQELQSNDTGTPLEIDENADGATDYSIDNPDFSFAQFRSNLVLRWEYLPGSEIFLVWAQGLVNEARPRSNVLESLSNQLLGSSMENTFLIKTTFRLYR